MRDTTPKQKRQPRLARSTREDLRVAPVRPDVPLPAASAHCWERPQLPLSPDSILLHYCCAVVEFQLRHHELPRFAAPGCACGEAVVQG